MSLSNESQSSAEADRVDADNALGWGLGKTADRMEAARQPGASREDVLDAVRLNWRLWTIIQTEQSEPDCDTPPNIRSGLQDLGVFVNRRSIELLSSADPRMLDVLITINRNIAAGLLGIDLAPEQRAARDAHRAFA